MLSNMAGKSFKQVQKTIGLLFVPIIVYHSLSALEIECAATLEYYLTITMTLLALSIWAGKMITLSNLWCDFSQTNFFITPHEKRQ